MALLSGIFAFLIAAAGWYYLFYSKAAHHLAGFEEAALNIKRIRLRRTGGAVLILLAMVLYIGLAVVDWDRPTLWFLVTWSGVMVLLGFITLLALIDLRLTQKLRRNRKRDKQ